MPTANGPARRRSGDDQTIETCKAWCKSRSEREAAGSDEATTQTGATTVALGSVCWLSRLGSVNRLAAAGQEARARLSDRAVVYLDDSLSAFLIWMRAASRTTVGAPSCATEFIAARHGFNMRADHVGGIARRINIGPVLRRDRLAVVGASRSRIRPSSRGVRCVSVRCLA